MNTKLPLLRALVAAVSLAALAVPGAALPLTAPRQAGPIVPVAGDCYAVGQQVANREGGTLANAQATSQGGRDVCVVVVLLPGKSGERPRRAEFVVPNN